MSSDAKPTDIRVVGVRLHAGSEFGPTEPMGADFRACANFGPVYK